MTSTDLHSSTLADPNDVIARRLRAMWSLGDYNAVSTQVIAELGRTIVTAAGVTRGTDVLDVAAGSGNASLPAAATGAHVVASDITPELLEIGRARAGELGLDLEWTPADASRLPFQDSRFDTVLSCVGVMFAPFHQPVADELVRVARPGATIALINWTPDGFIGQMFSALKPFAPAPPAGAQPGPLWGTVDHVRDLFGDRIDEFVAQRRTVRVDRFASAQDFLNFFTTCYGPTIAVYRNVADDPDATARLDAALLDLAREHGADTGSMDWEYLLVTARRR